MQNDEQTLEECDERAVARQTSKIRPWHWGVLIGVVCFRFGMAFQHYLDSRVIAAYSDTVEQCDELIDFIKRRADGSHLIIRKKDKVDPSTIV